MPDDTTRESGGGEVRPPPMRGLLTPGRLGRALAGLLRLPDGPRRVEAP